MQIIARILLVIPKVLNILLMNVFKSLFKKHGKNIRFFPVNSSFSYESIELGYDVYIGPGAKFSSITNITIGNKVMFGPNVTIMGGDHNFSVIGQYMFDVEEKLPSNDLPIVIEDDVWVGSNVTILKGVRIGSGSIISAGSVVTKNVAENSIVGGVPAKLLKSRFSTDVYIEHLKLINNV